jgi:hypothetical protein
MDKHATGQDETAVDTLNAAIVGEADAWSDTLATLAARFERNAADWRQDAANPDIATIYGRGYAAGQAEAWKAAALALRVTFTPIPDENPAEPYAPYADLTPLEAWNADGNR